MKFGLRAGVVVLFMAIFPMPEGYNIVVRYFITVISMLTILRDAEKGPSKWNWPLGIMVFVFNPAIPIHFEDPGYWVLVNLIAAAVLFFRQKEITNEDNSTED